MRLIKRLLKIIFFPHGAVFVLLIPLSAAMLVYAFAGTDVHTAQQYAAYFISAYSFTAFCCRTPSFMAGIRRIRNENKYALRYRSDARLRVSISLYASFIFNAAYAAFQLGLGIYHASVWFYSIAVYYILLAVMRCMLLNSLRGRSPGQDLSFELRRYRFCGIILILMNLSLSVIVFYITWQNRTFRHHEITTIAMAAYTFTSFAMAAINIPRYRKYNSPLYSAAKAISFAAAMVSMLTLETAMLTAFGGPEQEGFNRFMTGATGTVVLVSILAMAVYMTTKSGKALKKGATKINEQ